jgi:hypothetical protein
MGSRKISIRRQAANHIAAIAWFIESKGMVATADAFTERVYDFIEKMGNTLTTHAPCREPERAKLGYKCIPYRKKYTLVFIESETELIICEFIASKLIYW